MNAASQVADGAWLAFAWLAGPALLLTFAVGLLISVLQAATQVQDSSLSFAPKVGALVVLFTLAGAGLFHGVTHYATILYQSLPALIAGG